MGGGGWGDPGEEATSQQPELCRLITTTAPSQLTHNARNQCSVKSHQPSPMILCQGHCTSNETQHALPRNSYCFFLVEEVTQSLRSSGFQLTPAPHHINTQREKRSQGNLICWPISHSCVDTSLVRAISDTPGSKRRDY